MIYIKKAKYFKIQELVSKKVYDKYKEKAWSFIDPALIDTLDTLREHFGKPITVNNWLYGGELEQRCLRCNLDKIVADNSKKNIICMSAHVLGRAVDFNVKGLDPKAVAAEILKNQKKFPAIRRLENPEFTSSWTHIDLLDAGKSEIHVFNP